MNKFFDVLAQWGENIYRANREQVKSLISMYGGSTTGKFNDETRIK